MAGGPGHTIADGIAVKEPGDLTMEILGETLDDIVAVEDEQIAEAIVLLAERTKLVVEGAGAAAVAATLAGLAGGSGPVLALLSGGNIDASLMVQVMRRGLALSGRYLVVRTGVPDRPGELARLLGLLAAERVNVVEVEHQREAPGVPVGHTGMELTLLTRDPAHCEQLIAQMRDWGYPVERLD
jgi:threonine dehydratase